MSNLELLRQIGQAYLQQMSYTTYLIFLACCAVTLVLWLLGRWWILWASCGLCDFDGGFGRAAVMLLAALIVLLPVSGGVAFLATVLAEWQQLVASPGSAGTVFVTVLLLVHVAVGGLLYLPFVNLSLKTSYLVALFEVLLNLLFNLLLGGLLLAVLAAVQVLVVPHKPPAQPAQAPAAVRPS